ncbi:hypothetical protein SAMN05444277_102112 [Parafilimonas terrae]|uniref:Uncharacterized protein n=1 Tax=Parafilimonas terrae TaxID=1465490 RepID=A0A1I5TFU9_9BACT|nr:hypothetical protein SAMN05444277_102112 [Parafilimonas terrae]
MPHEILPVDYLAEGLAENYFPDSVDYNKERI